MVSTKVPHIGYYATRSDRFVPSRETKLRVYDFLKEITNNTLIEAVRFGKYSSDGDVNRCQRTGIKRKGARR